MGRLVEGVWQDVWYDTKNHGGRFEREESRFRNWVTPDGSPGPTGEGGFKAEPGRYHLYVSYACPWAHRTLIARKLKRLESGIGLSVVHWHMGADGWTFRQEEGATGDRLYGLAFLYQLYLKAKPDYSGRVTVPVLWDSAGRTIVNNESAEILRMLNGAFETRGEAGPDLYPEDLRQEIDEVNHRVYRTLNNGVYRAGFATTQEAYEEAYDALFETLDWLETRLSQQRYLVGEALTEADIRLLTTLLRFDAVYYGHFKCNRRRLIDYPNLWDYTRALYQLPGVAETVRLDHIKKHYYGSHRSINPSGIVPKGPELDFTQPHGRG